MMVLCINLDNIRLLIDETVNERRLVHSFHFVSQAESAMRTSAPREHVPRLCNCQRVCVGTNYVDNLVFEWLARLVEGLSWN